jgi:hypothetical protein
MNRALLLLTLVSCAKRPPDAAPERSALDIQRERAAVEGVDQTLEQVRLVSMALAAGDEELAERTLRQAVVRMQDFRADGQFRAMVGAERAKEWKGDPYEKMMAFLYLGVLLYDAGDYGNALAMTKSAILADTGTSRMQYRADFIPAFVLQALAHQRLGERTQSERSLGQAIDALHVRALTDHMSDLLAEVDVPTDDDDATEAARVLLLSGLPAGLFAHPRDPEQAISGALSRATDLRLLVIEGKKADRPPDLALLRKGPTRRALPHLDALARAWRDALAASEVDPLAGLDADATYLRSLLDDPPGLLLWVESGRGPIKVQDGRWGEILRIRPRSEGRAPRVTLDGHALRPAYLDSVTWQAQTRGARAVDGFLKGKAVFKDAAPALGWVLLESGAIADAVADSHDREDSTVGTVLAIAGLVTWIAGAATNPAADTRAWLELPDTLWLVRADPPPGEHTLRVDEREYTVLIPDRGTVNHLIPRLAPGGARTFGEPCRKCDVPLAIPGASPPPEEETP